MFKPDFHIFRVIARVRLFTGLRVALLPHIGISAGLPEPKSGYGVSSAGGAVIERRMHYVVGCCTVRFAGKLIL